jgi:hypothetical protein
MKTLLMSNRICTNCGWALDFKEKIGKPSLRVQTIFVFCLPEIFKNIIVRISIEYTVFPEMKLCSLVPKSYIHVSVSDLYIPRIGQPIWLQQNRQTDPGNVYVNRSQIHECGNWETEHYNSVLEITRPHSLSSGNT